MSDNLDAMTDQPTPGETRDAATIQAQGAPAPGAAGGPIDRMFGLIHEFGGNAVFGRPEQIGARTIIPVASIWYGFGFGHGGEHHEGYPHSEGVGGGGGGRITPVAVIIVEGDRVAVQPVVDVTRIATTALVLFGLVRLIRSFR